MNQDSTPGRTLAGRTLFITGASRGTGLAIALRAARDGANVVIAAKTVEPHPKLDGTIHSAARDVVAMGGNALPLALDVRDAEAIETAVETAGRHFGGIDICINNASAIHLGDTRQVDAKRFDLMHQVNARAAYLVSRACVPWLVALGLAEELRNRRHRLQWALVRNHNRDSCRPLCFRWGERPATCSKPAIVADAAHEVLCGDARTITGRFLLDEDVLRNVGVRDFDTYQYAPGETLTPDLFVAGR